MTKPGSLCLLWTVGIHGASLGALISTARSA